MKYLITLLAAVAFSSTATAGILTTTAGTKTIENVRIANEGTVNVENQQLPVTLIGAGLRAKKVVAFNVKVYIAELLSSDASKFVRDEAKALATLEDSRTIAVRLYFLRGVDAPTVQTSFSEALKANNINVAQPAMAQFLKAVADGGDAVSGKSLTIVTQKNADLTETVYYEDSNAKVTKISGPAGFSRQVMAIWLGTPSDAGVAALKTQIVKGL